MPEENFEQQTRRRAEEFGMEPNPNVWLRVKEAIAPAERRRRTLLWWWLLPLCAAGIVAVWLAENKKGGQQGEAIAATTNNKNEVEKREPQSVLKSSKTDKEQTGISNHKTGNTIKEHAPERELTMITHHQVNETAQNETFRERNQGERGDRVTTDQQIVPGTALIVTDHDHENKLIPLAKKPLPDLVVESNNDSHPFVMTDSANGKEVMNPASGILTAKDSTSNKTAADKAIQKKDGKKKWQVGVLTELGLASWGKDLLYNEVQANNYSKDLPLASSTAIDSFLANTSEIQQTKNGVDVAVGVVARKGFENHFYVSGQLGYRYQQYTIYNLRQSSAPQSGMLFSSVYLINKNQYRAYFLNLTVSAGRYLFINKRNALSAEVGSDNGLLLVMKKKNENPSSDFNLNKSLTTNDFYRWQSHVVVSLPFNWHSGDKVRLSLSPFARFGLHAFQKNGSNYKNNHLISAGIQAVYFFK